MRHTGQPRVAGEETRYALDEGKGENPPLFDDMRCPDVLIPPHDDGVGGTVASESALRSAGTFLSWTRAPPPTIETPLPVGQKPSKQTQPLLQI
ncbi:hypothetical protein PoB_002597400 [Plakobranchus ocellatus]|uniref:Uncharacterized protein n=1 Tax=Plakobranchus ocellatus TaxID=259542 RepID=A0AAV3ZYK8_9GAST|nr:hypothetical protein PoB_002597400 [Plakobranchus ocellatus]